MSTKSNRTFGQRIIELSELPRKKYFFWTAFVGSFPTFAIFYLISPVLHTKIGDFQYDLLAFFISSLLSAVMTTFFVSCSLDYMKYSPKVYGVVTNRTYLVLAKNKFVQGIFDLFTNSAENKLNPIWNERGKTIDQHTEQLAGQDYQIKSIKDDIKEIQDRLLTAGDYNKIIARLNRTIYDLNLRVKELETQLKEKKSENGEDHEVKILNEKLDQVTDALLKALEELRRFKGE